MPDAHQPAIAFVLGGGGHRGAFEVGMLQALFEAGIKPDVVLGTSIGAFNGAIVASDPSLASIDRLRAVWGDIADSEVFQGSWLARASSAVRNRTHVHSNEPLATILRGVLEVERFEELAIPFQCVAASIEDAAEHWFTEGDLLEALLATSAIPGLLPAVEIDGTHFIDGGVVNSIPISRALELGTRTIYVLQVGHIEEPLEVPTQPWEVAMVAFEISRRHRFHHDLASAPAGVTIHVLPTGNPDPKPYSDRSKLRYADFSLIDARIDAAHQATAAYLSELPTA